MNESWDEAIRRMGRQKRVEPDADTRQTALAIRSQYVAYVESGFTPKQAMEIVVATVTVIVGEAMRGGQN